VSRNEPEAHTFLVRVWMEEVPRGNGGLVWRGHITHLPDEERRYVQSFGEIRDVIDHYLRPEGCGS
jgi:hypothetical protein